MNNQIDFKRNNKVALRNFSESCDFHDVVKTLLVRMLRRKNKNAIIYTENNPRDINSCYPDIWMQIKKDVYVWEIQSRISEKWIKEINKKYEDQNLIIVDLESLEKAWHDNHYPLEVLKRLLNVYII